MKQAILNQKLLNAVIGVALKDVALFKAMYDQQYNVIEFRYLPIIPKNKTITDEYKEQMSFLSKYLNARETGMFEKLLHILKTGVAIDNTFSYPYGNSIKWLHIVVQNFLDIILISMDDITEKKLSEETIRQLNRVLVIKSEKLELLNAELKTFGNIAAHDYSDTLRSAYIQLEFIIHNDGRNLSNAGRANIRRAQAGIQKMKLLTEDIVTYTQIPALNGEVSPVDLNDILANVLGNMHEIIAETGADIIVGPLPTIQGFTYLLFLLFYNIIANAIKFKRKNESPVIQIRYSQANRIPGKMSSTNETYRKISIIDNGIGFEQKDAENIFIIFYQLNDKFKYKGSGVGLAICKKIMAVHNGFITADSTPGEGTSIDCFFPQLKE
jgi:signal transduction histidine kinase